MNDDAPRATSVALPALLEDAARRSAAYLRSLEQRPVRPDPDAVLRLARLDEPLPAGPSDPAGVLALLDETRFAGHDGDGRAALLRLRDRRLAARGAGGELAGGRLGPERVPGEDHSRCRAGRGGGAALAGGGARPARQTEGAFVTGATMANFTALAAARHAVLARAGWNVEADGLFGAPPITVVVGDEAHPTLLKSLGLLGLGRNAGRARAGRTRRGACAPIALPPIGGPDDRLRAGRQRQHRRVRSVRRDLPASRGPPAPGCTSTARSACGPGLRRSWRHWRTAWSSPTPGRPTPTSGSTCPTTAASRSCANPARCRRRWRSPPTTFPCTTPSAAPPISRRSSRGARAAWRSGRRCARSGRSGLAEMIERNCRQARRFAARLARGRLRDPQRRRAEPGAGLVRRRRTPRSASSTRSRPTARAGAAGRSGRAARRCGSASARGRRRTRTSSAASAAMLRAARAAAARG